LNSGTSSCREQAGKFLQKGEAKDGKNYKTEKGTKKKPTQQTIAVKSTTRNPSSFSVFQLDNSKCALSPPIFSNVHT
jgi:hypothetical protein